MHTRQAGSSYNKSSAAKRKSTGGTSRNKATGKKGQASSTDFEINEENMAFFRAMQAKLKTEKKAAAASQDEGKLLSITTSSSNTQTPLAIRERNKALMEKESNGDEGDEEMDPPPAKRFRTEAMILDEEEADIASGLRPVHETRKDVSHLEEDTTISQDLSFVGSEDELYSEGVGDAVNNYRGDGGTEFENNGVCP